MLEPCTLVRVRRGATRDLIAQTNTWAEILSDTIGEFEGSQIIVNTSQIRLQVAMQPALVPWIRQYNLDVVFRGKSYKVVSRQEMASKVILTCDELGR